MWGELGHYCLILAFAVCIAQSTLPLIGTYTGKQSYMMFARSCAYVQWWLILISYVALTYLFIDHDYSVKYVANNSNNAQPLIYRISGVWGAHEGSLLLWIFMLSSWTALVAKFSKGIPRDVIAQVLAVLGMVSIGFISFTVFTSNPFERLFPVPADGRELNPLLQDPGLAIHPPMLYMGYVGFSVVFAFAIAAMISGKLDTAWARWARPWTTVAWLFLTIGIVLGSWWAYYELGWGGWWFWDPVENASFMPWLLGTALIHSLAVTEKRGAFKAWTVLLAILTFSLVLLGTFLVRSGVLTSVHSFASDPARGLYILIFLLLVVGGSLFLYAVRAPRIRSEVNYSLFSKETSLLANNVLLAITCAMVLLGTLYPLLIDAVSGQKISVGPPYFDSMFLPLTLPLVFIVGIGAMSRWKKDELSRFSKTAIVIALASIILGAIGTSLLSEEQFQMGGFVGLTLALWVVFWSLQALLERLKNQSSYVQGIKKVPASIWGMAVAHIGLGVFILGVSHVNTYSVEKDIAMSPNDTFKIRDYEFEFKGVQNKKEANYFANEGHFIVSLDNRQVTELKPQKRFYSTSSPMTEAAINTTLGRDLYVSLGDEIENREGTWSVRLYYKSFVACIWLGGFIMALGGLISILDRRYRRPIKASPKATAS